jgi:hypothetical protein
MPDPIRLWIEISHHSAFRVGGWAFVQAEGAFVSGAAGGERSTTAERIALAGLLAALKAAPPGAAVEIRASGPILAIPARLAVAEAGDDPPTEDLAAWAQLSTALKARSARFVRVAAEPKTPAAFALAWAELARDKAKAKGAFSAPIPKPNLAGAGVKAD